MKTVIVFLPRALATSFIHSGIFRCAIRKRHYTISFVTRNEKEMYEKLLQSKDETIRILAKSKEDAIHILTKSKDESSKLKDDMLKSKDDMLKSKEDAIHILAKSKDETIHILAESKDDMLKSKDDLLSAANAEILYLQGRLSLRSVFEQFEQRYEGLLDTSISTKGITRREKLWKAIIENNAGGIMQYLGDTTTDWPSVAQSLYKLISKDIHNFMSKKVIINDINHSHERTNLAVTLCKMYPIKYKIVSPSSVDQE